MEIDDSALGKLLSRDFTDAVIRIGLIIFLVILCVRVLAPFMSLLLWAIILAIALYPLHQRLARGFGGRQGSSAMVVVVFGLLLIGTPLVMLGSSFAKRIHASYAAIQENAIVIPQPDPAVAKWPIVGKKIYQGWSKAAANLPEFLQENKTQLQNLSSWALSATANTLGSVLLFLAALVVAGIMMAYGESGGNAMLRIFSRLAGPVRGPRLQNLSTATIRSVASGVIGVAFIQALLLGVGFVLAGIPAAGVLAVIVMFIGIMQLPAAIVTLPAIAYLWWSGGASTTGKIAYTVYLLLAGMSDVVLKPLLLGRGVDVPMPVILIGALGGMVWGGIIGLFVGAVLLAVGYRIFMDWVENAGGSDEPGQLETTDQISSQGE